MPKKIKAIYLGPVPIFVYGQGVIKKGEEILVNKRDLERPDIIKKFKKEKKK